MCSLVSFEICFFEHTSLALRNGIVMAKHQRRHHEHQEISFSARAVSNGIFNIHLQAVAIEEAAPPCVGNVFENVNVFHSTVSTTLVRMLCCGIQGSQRQSTDATDAEMNSSAPGPLLLQSVQPFAGPDPVRFLFCVPT